MNAEGRRFDLVVFGATGFTGQYTVDEVSRVAEEERLSWAVAGRSMEKLQKVLSEASERTGKTLEEIPVIIADVSSPQSLAEMAKQTKVVLNCVGPYRFYGEPVVQACIENGTHHLDISGEPQFLEKMQLLYNKKAAENNVFVIGSVGFDSIPAEIGLEYTRQQFKEGELSNVESFIETKVGPEGAVINTGTFESAVYGVAYRNELGSLRKALYPDPMPKLDYRLPKRSFLFFNDDLKKWCLPFLGSDKSVVYRTIRDGLNSQRLKKPIEFIPYTCCSSLFSAMGIILFGLVFFFLSSFSWGRSFLLKYPHIVSLGFFKKGGPTRKQIESTSFSMTFVGYGYTEDVTDRTGQKPNKTIVTKLMGPEPGYVTTPICMVQSAVTLLKESSNMFHKGGVLTPGAAFSGTNLMERLQKHNITLMTISPDNSQDKKAD
ncbi:saccharopine dehydrogenase-like oxidoreductase [Biomphalaria glabrata]|uniref:Saccharopine dehydrogenase-like oxidoreductase n=1 Tax=Biomphalaria glabrata TaxID=6526 RepID=A0A2C9LN82_BIOGL|nr:saccharopine dehydrogenase-like oxidoreductase [Biomphalaria glabrata]